MRVTCRLDTADRSCKVGRSVSTTFPAVSITRFPSIPWTHTLSNVLNQAFLGSMEANFDLEMHDREWEVSQPIRVDRIPEGESSDRKFSLAQTLPEDVLRDIFLALHDVCDATALVGRDLAQVSSSWRTAAQRLCAIWTTIPIDLARICAVAQADDSGGRLTCRRNTEEFGFHFNSISASEYAQSHRKGYTSLSAVRDRLTLAGDHLPLHVILQFVTVVKRDDRFLWLEADWKRKTCFLSLDQPAIYSEWCSFLEKIRPRLQSVSFRGEIRHSSVLVDMAPAVWSIEKTIGWYLTGKFPRLSAIVFQESDMKWAQVSFDQAFRMSTNAIGADLDIHNLDRLSAPEDIVSALLPICPQLSCLEVVMAPGSRQILNKIIDLAQRLACNIDNRLTTLRVQALEYVNPAGRGITNTIDLPALDDLVLPVADISWLSAPNLTRLTLDMSQSGASYSLRADTPVDIGMHFPLLQELTLTSVYVRNPVMQMLLEQCSSLRVLRLLKVMEFTALQLLSKHSELTGAWLCPSLRVLEKTAGQKPSNAQVEALLAARYFDLPEGDPGTKDRPAQLESLNLNWEEYCL